MSAYCKLMDSMSEMGDIFSGEISDLIGNDQLDLFYDKFKKNMGIFKKTGGIVGLQTQLKLLESSNKENIAIVVAKENSVSGTDDDSNTENAAGTGRPRRRAFKEASHVMNKQLNQPLNRKMRRPDNDGISIEAIVKVERLSEEIVGQMLPPSDIPLKKPQKKKHVKTEPVENMRESRSRSKRNTRKSPVKSISPTRDSEIILQTPVPITVSLDSDEEEPQSTAPTRSNRTTRQTKQAIDNTKRLRSPVQDELNKPNKSRRTKGKNKISKIEDDCENELEPSVSETADFSITSEPSKQSSQTSTNKISGNNLQADRSNGKKSSIKVQLNDETPPNKTLQVNATMVVQGKNSHNEIDSTSNINNTMTVEERPISNKTIIISASNINNTMVVEGKKSHNENDSASNINNTMAVEGKEISNKTIIISASNVNNTMVVEGKKSHNEIDSASNINNTMAVEGKTISNKTIIISASNINNTVVVEGKKSINENHVIDSAPNVNNTMVLSSNVNNTIVLSSNINGTMNIDSKINETKVITKKVNEEQIVDDLMTDDESFEEQSMKPVKGPQPIFNPFENSPVKKRVEAFEKLGTQTPVNQPIRVTRTNTRKLAKEKRDGSQIPVRGTTTPSSINRQIGSTTINRHISSNTVAKLHKEKEAEAAQKKDALMKAHIEEKRKKREERELKAKQQRENLEKEKLKALDIQKVKEEKQKLIQLEKLEKLQKQREENEKKRQLAKQKHEEKKRELERKRAEDELKKQKEEADRKKAELALRQKEAETIKKPLKNGVQSKVLPIYMLQKAPLLPSYDCYDSDEERTTKTMEKPQWVHSEYMHASLATMGFIDNKLKNTLFCPKPQTPDLRDIFQNIDPKKLRRNSSAIWDTQPRFTIMPKSFDDL